MSEPIPFAVTRYRCPTCPRTSSGKARMAEHIGRCWHNPEARGCKTCANYEHAGDGDQCLPGQRCDCNNYPEGCSVGVDLRRFDIGYEGEWPNAVEVRTPNGATLPIVHCEKWELIS